MLRVAAAIAVPIAALLMSTPAIAQSSPASRPGPYVIDVRAPMSGLPSTSGFHPVLPGNTLVPKRGFGLSGGGHVYVATLGPSRLGLGLDVMRVRGTAVTPAATTTSATSSTSTGTTPSVPAASALSPNGQVDVAMTMTAIAPQVSFNFGTREGWSYLSGGYGYAQLRGTATGEALGSPAGPITLVRDDGRSGAINYGGGARWFIRDHAAVGFDLRLLKIAAIGTRRSTTLVVASVGLSIR